MSVYIRENYNGMSIEELEKEYARLNRKSNLILFEMRLNLLKLEEINKIIRYRKYIVSKNKYKVRRSLP